MAWQIRNFLIRNDVIVELMWHFCEPFTTIAEKIGSSFGKVVKA